MEQVFVAGDLQHRRCGHVVMRREARCILPFILSPGAFIPE
jgi:hypothetical protein